MSVKDRIAAKKAAKGAAAPAHEPDASGGGLAVAAPAGKISRARRFASAGVVDDAPTPEEMDSAPSPAPAPVAPLDPPVAVRIAAPAASPATPSRAARFAEKVAARAMDSVPAARNNHEVPTTPDEPARESLQWDDPDRPAGSAYSAQEWADAMTQSPDKTVFEVLKSEERALVTKDRDANDVVLHRSLVVHEMAHSDWRDHATISMEHHGPFGLQRYVVIRARTEREKSPWADGSKLVIRDKGYEEESRPSRSERFRA